MTGLPEMDANDTFFLNNASFQQQFLSQLDTSNQNDSMSMDQQRGNSSLDFSDSSLLGGCDPTPIGGTMNVNRSGGQQQQQIFELMQAMSARQQNSLGLNFNNSSSSSNNNVGNSNLLQQQFFQQQQNAANNMQNQNQQRLQLTNLLGNQPQTQIEPLQQQQQQRHSLSLGMGSNSNDINALLALQQLRGGNQLPGGMDQPTKPSASSVNAQKKQKEFLLFIKILLKCLSTTQNHLLKERTKQIVAECTKRNRLGDPAYMPLQAAVEQRLRPVVGEQFWTRAQNYLQSYHTKQPQLAQQIARFRQQRRQQDQQVMRIARC